MTLLPRKVSLGQREQACMAGWRELPAPSDVERKRMKSTVISTTSTTSGQDQRFGVRDIAGKPTKVVFRYKIREIARKAVTNCKGIGGPGLREAGKANISLSPPYLNVPRPWVGSDSLVASHVFPLSSVLVILSFFMACNTPGLGKILVAGRCQCGPIMPFAKRILKRTR
ncbi:uncharacterized protein BT62DRAFT_1077578, partial [Guyanagaster necrorhizus]